MQPRSEHRCPARAATRRSGTLAAAALAGALAANHAVAAPDAGFPKRKAGLWEVRVASSQAAGLPPTQFCVGDDTDAPRRFRFGELGTEVAEERREELLRRLGPGCARGEGQGERGGQQEPEPPVHGPRLACGRLR